LKIDKIDVIRIETNVEKFGKFLDKQFKT